MQLKIKLPNIDLGKASSAVKDTAKTGQASFKGLFNVQSYIQKGKDIVDLCGSRHEVPDLPFIPEDLDDREGNWQLTKNHFPVPGVIPQADYETGCQSPAAPIYMMLFPFVMMFSSLLKACGFISLSVLVDLVYLWFYHRFFGEPWSFGLGFFMFPNILLTPLIPLLNHFMPFELSSQIGGFMQKAITYSSLIACTFPLFYLRSYNRNLAKSLGHMGNTYNGPALAGVNRSAKATRTLQIANAAKDTSYRMVFGTADETLAKNGDKLAADSGKPILQTPNDQKTGMIIFGEPGSGKTAVIKGLVANLVIAESVAKQQARLPDADKKQITKDHDNFMSKFSESLMEQIKKQKEEHEFSI